VWIRFIWLMIGISNGFWTEFNGKEARKE